VAGFQHCIKESYVLLVTIMQLLLLQLLRLLLERDVVGHQQLPQIGDRVLEAIDLVLCNRQARWSYRCGRSRGRNVTALTQRLHTGNLFDELAECHMRAILHQAGDHVASLLLQVGTQLAVASCLHCLCWVERLHLHCEAHAGDVDLVHVVCKGVCTFCNRQPLELRAQVIVTLRTTVHSTPSCVS
jgi:hypothetical protein